LFSSHLDHSRSVCYRVCAARALGKHFDACAQRHGLALHSDSTHAADSGSDGGSVPVGGCDASRDTTNPTDGTLNLSESLDSACHRDHNNLVSAVAHHLRLLRTERSHLVVELAGAD
jgi:hypothetical protein